MYRFCKLMMAGRCVEEGIHSFQEIALTVGHDDDVYYIL